MPETKGRKIVLITGDKNTGKTSLLNIQKDIISKVIIVKNMGLI